MTFTADQFADMLDAMTTPARLDCGGLTAYRGKHPHLGEVVIITNALDGKSMMIGGMADLGLEIEIPELDLPGVDLAALVLPGNDDISDLLASLDEFDKREQARLAA